MTSIYDYHNRVQREHALARALLVRHEQNLNISPTNREHLKSAASLIERGLKRLNNAEGWRSLIETTRRFPTHSPENQLLIASNSTGYPSPTRERQDVIRHIPWVLTTVKEALRRGGNDSHNKVKVIAPNGEIVSMVRDGGVEHARRDLFSDLFAPEMTGLTKNTLHERMLYTAFQLGCEMRQLDYYAVRKLSSDEKEKLVKRGYFFQQNPDTDRPILIAGPDDDLSEHTIALSHALALSAWLKLADHFPAETLKPLAPFVASGLRHALTNLALDTLRPERFRDPSGYWINAQQWPDDIDINNFYAAHTVTSTTIKEILRSLSYHKSKIDRPWDNTGMDELLSDKKERAYQRIAEIADYSLIHHNDAAVNSTVLNQRKTLDSTIFIQGEQLTNRNSHELEQ